jgi:hypothetical protein
VNQDFEPLDVPMYSPAMASRLVGLESSRVRRWLQGYEYTYQYASFVDLIDLLFVKKFVEHGISVQRLRKALDEAVDLTGEHHFAHRRFWTERPEDFPPGRRLTTSRSGPS